MGRLEDGVTRLRGRNRGAEVVTAIVQSASLAIVSISGTIARKITNTMMDEWRTKPHPKDLGIWEYGDTILKRIEPHFHLALVLLAVNIVIFAWLQFHWRIKWLVALQVGVLLVNVMSLLLMFASYMTLKGA